MVYRGRGSSNKSKGRPKYALGKYKDRLPTGFDLNSEGTKKDIAKELNSEERIDSSDIVSDEFQVE